MKIVNIDNTASHPETGSEKLRRKEMEEGWVGWGHGLKTGVCFETFP